MKTRLSYERVRREMEVLELTSALQALDNVLEAARLEELPPVEAMDRLMEVEVKARHERRVETNLKFAGLPYRQPLEAFDFEAQPSIDSGLIERLATLRFIEEGTNILLLGPPGVGKTALAVGLSMKALESGLRIYFITCRDMVAKYRKALRYDRVERLLSALLRPKLLIPEFSI